MCFEDFVKHFNRIHVLRMMTDSKGVKWNHKTFKSEWKGESAGGCFYFTSWPNNPQFRLISPYQTKIFVFLSQPDLKYINGQKFKSDGRDENKSYHYQPIGIHVLKSKPTYRFKRNTYTDDEQLTLNTFSASRDIGTEFVAEANTPYVIIPCSFELKSNKL